MKSILTVLAFFCFMTCLSAQELQFKRGKFHLKDQTFKISQLKDHLNLQRFSLMQLDELQSVDRNRTAWIKMGTISGASAGLGVVWYMSASQSEDLGDQVFGQVFSIIMITIGIPMAAISTLGFVNTSIKRSRRINRFIETYNVTSASKVEYELGIHVSPSGLGIGMIF